MARKPSPALTDAEAQIMAVLWQLESATVSQVVTALCEERTVTYSTVQTMLRILEAKGYVMHGKEGRAFVYRPAIDAHHARRRALRHLVSRLFEGSPALVVLSILEDDEIDEAERKRLKRLIDRA